MSLEDRDGVGDFPDVSDVEFDQVKRELLIALRHNRVRASGGFCVYDQHSPEDLGGPWEMASTYHWHTDSNWPEFLNQHASKADEAFGTYVSHEPASISCDLWQEICVDWNGNALKFRTETHRLVFGSIELCGADLQTVFLPAGSSLKTSDPSLPQQKPASTKEVDSMLKLVVGMAAAKYGYVPAVPRSAAASRITNDLARLGIPMDEDTVRKYLRRADEFLPPKEID